MLFAGLFLAFAGCRQAATEGDAVAYPDLKALTDQFIAVQARQQGALQKIIRSPASVDTVTLSPVNWTAELAAFQAYDLAHPVLKGLYRVDSTVSGNRARLRYRAAKDDLAIQQAVLVKEQNRPVWFALYDSTDNVMYNSNKLLSLHLDSGCYHIQIRQQSWLFKPLVQDIRGQLLDSSSAK
jgi:hypothetical protein